MRGTNVLNDSGRSERELDGSTGAVHLQIGSLRTTVSARTRAGVREARTDRRGRDCAAGQRWCQRKREREGWMQ